MSLRDYFLRQASRPTFQKPISKKHITEFACGSTAILAFDDGDHIPAQIIAVHPHFVVRVYTYDYKLDRKTDRLIYQRYGQTTLSLPANGWDYNDPLP